MGWRRVRSLGRRSSRTTDRENVRLTAFGELRATDFFSNKLLTRILGHHTITGLYSEERYDTEDRNWARYAATEEWADKVGAGFTPGGSQDVAHVAANALRGHCE